MAFQESEFLDQTPRNEMISFDVKNIPNSKFLHTCNVPNCMTELSLLPKYYEIGICFNHKSAGLFANSYGEEEGMGREICPLFNFYLGVQIDLKLGMWRSLSKLTNQFEKNGPSGKTPQILFQKRFCCHVFT